MALDGVSLTVVAGDESGFDVVLVPETLEATELAGLQVDHLVHVEVDLLARYVAHQLGITGGRQPRPSINLEMLKRHGLA